MHKTFKMRLQSFTFIPFLSACLISWCDSILGYKVRFPAGAKLLVLSRPSWEDLEHLRYFLSWQMRYPSADLSSVKRTFSAVGLIIWTRCFKWWRSGNHLGWIALPIPSATFAGATVLVFSRPSMEDLAFEIFSVLKIMVSFSRFEQCQKNRICGSSNYLD